MTDRDPLEPMLASLTPAPAILPRDRLYFEAGRAAGARGVQHWRLATGLGLCASVMLAVFAFMRPPAVIVEREVVQVEKPTPSMASPRAPVESPTASEDLVRWLKLRNQVVAIGIDELPPAPSGDGVTTRRLRGPWNPLD